MLSIRRATKFLHNKGFNVSLTARIHNGLNRYHIDAWRDDGQYLFSFNEYSTIVRAQPYPYKEGNTQFVVTSQFVEDYATIKMIQRDCWTDD